MLATVVRSGLVEARHDGAIALVDPDGRPWLKAGDVDRAYFLRSAAKPVQAAVSLDAGVELAPEEIAVAAASHDGDPAHIALIGAVLGRFGLGEEDLRCPPAWPLSPAARDRLAAAGHRRPRRIWHNCSGKHAAMLAACVVQGWPVATYLDKDHPLQVRIAADMERIFGPGTGPAGVDGCGAPVFRCTTASVARGYARLLRDDVAAPVVSAMARFPALVSGVANVDASLATSVGGIAKRGAEGLLAVGLPDRGALAVKVWDGSSRAIGPVAAAVLGEAGLIPGGAATTLEWAMASPVLGGVEEVGRVMPAVDLEPW